MQIEIERRSKDIYVRCQYNNFKLKKIFSTSLKKILEYFLNQIKKSLIFEQTKREEFHSKCKIIRKKLVKKSNFLFRRPKSTTQNSIRSNGKNEFEQTDTKDYLEWGVKCVRLGRDV